MRRFAVGLIVLVWGACTAGGEPSAAVEVVDSAGVRLVTHLSLRAPEWVIEPRPVLDLGTVGGEGPDQFFRVSAARRLREGGIAIFNAGSSEVRVFRRDGTYVRSFGGDGEGPGEFRGPARMFRMPGDSLALWDTRLRRLSIFDLNGVLGRSISPRGIGRRPEILTVLPSGSTLFEQEILLGGVPQGFAQQYSTYLLFDASGELVDSLPTQPRVEVGLWGDGPMVGPRLFDEGTQLAGDSLGYWIGTTKAEELTRYSLAGQVEMVVRWPAEDRTVGSNDARLALQERLDGLPPGTDPARATELHNSITVAERFPAHGPLLVDRLGALWVQEYERPGRNGPTRWWVFGADGVLVANVNMPRGHRLFDVGGDYVLAQGRDELDVEHIRLFRLTRGAYSA